MRAAALQCVRQTPMTVFPVSPYSKHPLVKCGRGFCHASNDEAQVARWWTWFPKAMVGLPTGEGNGKLVLDVDVHSNDANGKESLAALKSKGFALPSTFTVETASGGLHYYFRYPAGVDIRNSAGKIGPGLDVRGNGGFVVAPGSRRFDGRKYRVVNSVSPADAPQWLVDECLKPSPRKNRKALSKAELVIGAGCTMLAVLFPDRYRAAVFDNSRRQVAEAKKGTRNNTLFYNATRLYSFLAGGTFASEWEIDAALHNACVQNGLAAEDGEKSVRDTMNSAKRHGFENPMKIVRMI